MWLYQVFRTFLHHTYIVPRSSRNYDADNTIRALLQDQEYSLHRQRPGVHNDPWRIPWQAGEIVTMSALCFRDRHDEDEYCIRCGEYNSLSGGFDRDSREGIEWYVVCWVDFLYAITI